MTQMILFLLIGAVLLASLLLLARRGSRPEGGAEALIAARQALKQLQISLLPSEMIGRLMAVEDFEFVASNAPGPVNSLFRRWRKKIVLAWIHQVRHQVKSLQRFHLGAARYYARLSFRSEVSLAIDFASLLVACRTMQILVWIFGPLAAPRMAGATAAFGLRICEVSENALAFLNAPNAVLERSLIS
jgi:hypothetical protein